jgi:hypothetical protein
MHRKEAAAIHSNRVDQVRVACTENIGTDETAPLTTKAKRQATEPCSRSWLALR